MRQVHSDVSVKFFAGFLIGCYGGARGNYHIPLFSAGFFILYNYNRFPAANQRETLNQSLIVGAGILAGTLFSKAALQLTQDYLSFSRQSP